MRFRFLVILMPSLVMSLGVSAFAQAPPIEPGVSQELAKWRAARYSDVRYKLNLTLEKMSPVLKGTMEIRVNVGGAGSSVPLAVAGGAVPIVLDWRKIKGHEDKSTISNVSINGKTAVRSSSFSWPPAGVETSVSNAGPPKGGTPSFGELNEHLIFNDGVVAGENVIQLDFTSPILTSGSAITRYVDKEDGSEYLYSLFVPSDASTAFPVFDQPDIKGRFQFEVFAPEDWIVVSNESKPKYNRFGDPAEYQKLRTRRLKANEFLPTKPISTYVFAFAAGPFEKVEDNYVRREMVESVPLAHDEAAQEDYRKRAEKGLLPTRVSTSLYVRKSQAAKFKAHAAEVFRLNREAVKYFEEYFDYKFPFPKYDLVLIPEFPFGGMENAGATFLREASIIFPQEPTKNDHISRATLIFHEAAHQWFGDTVTMRWFDDLWLKEGFATFTAYKAMEKIMPEMNAWKVFYERVKQAAYQTDSTKGTTAIYQPIANLSAAKSAYGNIVYNKAPAFLRQAEFYLGEDKFQAAVRAFLKKHDFRNAGWEDLVREFERASNQELNDWARQWVKVAGLPSVRINMLSARNGCFTYSIKQTTPTEQIAAWKMRTKVGTKFPSGYQYLLTEQFTQELTTTGCDVNDDPPVFLFGNYLDYGYGIFLLDEKSREYVLKNIQNEKDPFLRSMMWGALWDSVREGELDPREYVELVVNVLQKPAREQGLNGQGGSKALTNVRASAIEDESTTALLLSRVGTAMNYYLSEPRAVATGFRPGSNAESPVATAPGSDLRTRVEEMVIAGIRNSPTQGQRITYYRALLNIASGEKARGVLKEMLKGGNASVNERVKRPVDALGSIGHSDTLPNGRVSASIPIKTKDKFDIVTRLLILNDAEAPKLLAELEKTETSDDAKRYAYAAKAGIGTAENKAKYWNDYVTNKDISESWIEAAFGPWNSIRHSELTLPYLQKALQELPNHKRSRKIFFVNGWLGAFIGGQRSEAALAIVNKFLADNPNLDNDLRLKILENVDVIERAVRIRGKY